jgi:DNA primase
LRAKDRAPVAVPVDWGEIRDKNFRPDGVTLETIFSRLERNPDPWKDFRGQAVSLDDVRRKVDQMLGRHAA